jgi:glycogen synthase
MQESKKILLVGPYPPPYGGISVQIQRLQRLLQSHGFACSVLNIGENRSRNIQNAISVKNYIQYFYLLIKFSLKGYIIHITTSGHNFKSWVSAFACVFAGLCNSKRSVVTLGSGMLPKYICNSKRLEKFIIRFTLQFAGVLIIRNAESEIALIEAGAEKGKIHLIRGYIDVDASEVGTVPGDIFEFMSNHNPVVGAHVIRDPEYGLPLLLVAFKTLEKELPRLGMVLIGLNQRDAEQLPGYLDNQDNIIATGYLQHNQSLAIMKNLDVFIRATYFDGDSNSVREALSLNVPVVASATDYRPDGVFLFEIGNNESLTKQVKKALENCESVTNSKDDDNTFEKLLTVYCNL